MNVNLSNFFVKKLLAMIQHYNKDSYWRMRSKVVNSTPPPRGINKLLRYFYLYRIKRADAFNNASMGTDIRCGAEFATPPNLPHGLNGIIVGHSAKIGRNVTICQQVTIMHGAAGFPRIGDNVLIGAGAKILGSVTIGHNARIGANAVVTRDIPPNCTAVGVPAKIISEYISGENGCD